MSRTVTKGGAGVGVGVWKMISAGGLGAVSVFFGMEREFIVLIPMVSKEINNISEIINPAFF